jgi:hypothetical protein
MCDLPQALGEPASFPTSGTDVLAQFATAHLAALGEHDQPLAHQVTSHDPAALTGVET